MSSKIHNVPLIFHLNYFKSPLYLAVENGNKKEILDDLLKTKVSFPIKSEDGDSPPEGKSPVHAAIKQRNRGDHNVITH